MNRIPELKDNSPEAMQEWFNQMFKLGLDFHPDDDPADVVNYDDTRCLSRVFSDEECDTLKEIMEELFDIHGDSVYDAGLKAGGYVPENEEEALCKQLEGWQKANKLPLMCAFEQLTENNNLTEEQRQWLTDYCKLWDEMEESRK